MARTRSGSGSAGDADFLAAALRGYEQQRSQIEARMAELRKELGRRGAGNSAGAWSGSTSAPARKKRTLSAAARERIAEAQRKRWAAARQGSKPSAAERPAAAAQRRMSAAARKRIADAARKRWAAFRANKAAAAAPKAKTAGA
ncbi:MAG TPA: hypothetical protein VKT49_19860 [Bryobacteraceae bacterium]|nr:hypothetical protein [Bryobacteraceae bacterium]